MAGNFWQSSHFHQWVIDTEDILLHRQVDLQKLTDEEYQKLHIFYINFIQALGEQLKLRQQVIATAIIYFKRFYSRNSLQDIDPLLMAPTSIFLSSKVEEFGVTQNSRLTTACTSVIKSKYSYCFASDFPYKINHILECEFLLMEMMDCCLIVYQPYRPLVQYVNDLNDPRLLPIAWKIVNDSLRSDVILKYPPFMIALTALHMACVIAKAHDEHRKWFAELNLNLDFIEEITTQILSLYEIWKSFKEKEEIPLILSKAPKPTLQNR